MVVKVEIDGENRRKLIVLGRNVGFWLVDDLVEEEV